MIHVFYVFFHAEYDRTIGFIVAPTLKVLQAKNELEEFNKKRENLSS